MSLEDIILQAWEDRNSINKNSDKKIISAINETLENLDSGTIRVCEKKNNEWHTHQWIKKAILLSFKTQDNKMISGPYAKWFDKVDGKTALWDEKKLLKAGFRVSAKWSYKKICIHWKKCCTNAVFYKCRSLC